MRFSTVLESQWIELRIYTSALNDSHGNTACNIFLQLSAVAQAHLEKFQDIQVCISPSEFAFAVHAWRKRVQLWWAIVLGWFFVVPCHDVPCTHAKTIEYFCRMFRVLVGLFRHSSTDPSGDAFEDLLVMPRPVHE